MILLSQVKLCFWVMGSFGTVQCNSTILKTQLLEQFLNHVLRPSTIHFQILTSYVVQISIHTPAHIGKTFGTGSDDGGCGGGRCGGGGDGSGDGSRNWSSGLWPG